MKRFALILATIVLSSSCLLAQKRAMTTDDGLNLTSLRSAIISPDGQSVIYQADTLNWKKNKRGSTFYHCSIDGQNLYQFLGTAGGSDLKYSTTHLNFGE